MRESDDEWVTQIPPSVRAKTGDGLGGLGTRESLSVG